MGSSRASVIVAARSNRQAIIFLTCGFFYILLLLLSIFFPRLISAVRISNAGLKCVACARLAGNAGPKKSPKNRHLGTIAQLCQAISSQLRHVSTIGKKWLNSNVSSPTRPHNMVNFSLLAAEICWRV